MLARKISAPEWLRSSPPPPPPPPLLWTDLRHCFQDFTTVPCTDFWVWSNFMICKKKKKSCRSRPLKHSTITKYQYTIKLSQTLQWLLRQQKMGSHYLSVINILTFSELESTWSLECSCEAEPPVYVTSVRYRYHVTWVGWALAPGWLQLAWMDAWVLTGWRMHPSDLFYAMTNSLVGR